MYPSARVTIVGEVPDQKHISWSGLIPIKFPIIPIIQYLLFSIILNEEHLWATSPSGALLRVKSPAYRCQRLIAGSSLRESGYARLILLSDSVATIWASSS